MKILLATGIYPPDIGGPATYVQHLAHELTQRGMEVIVVTYGKNAGKSVEGPENGPTWTIVTVGKSGGPLLRWQRYAKALKEQGSDADIVYAFSTVSCAVPLRMARLEKPRKMLRLGGDFLWERYTDLGGRRSLRGFYRRYKGLKSIVSGTLRAMDALVFSTSFQEQLYLRTYGRLPMHAVVQNALPQGRAEAHARHEPFRLLFMGRFVRFKNLPSLLTAVSLLPHVQLTLVGDGPVAAKASELARSLGLQRRVSFLPTSHGGEREVIFRDHDLLVVPSLTEISPHIALEARAAGLPVLLTEENGLSPELCEGMLVRPLQKSDDIVRSILEAEQNYDQVSAAASAPTLGRAWGDVAEEHIQLFEKVLASPRSKVLPRPRRGSVSQ